MTVHLVSWFHADAERFKSTYSQTLGDSTSASHYAVYERCLRVFFASARRWNPDAELHLVTNVPAEGIFVSGTIELFERLGVRRTVVQNDHETPVGYYGKWQNQFYVLDVTRAVLGASPSVREDDVVIVLDSDCLVTGPVTPELVGPTGLASLIIPTPADVQENGVSPREMAALATDFPGTDWPGSPDGIAPYLGGEVLAARVDVLRRILQRGEQIFPWALERRAAGLPSLNEEAHLLSLAVHTLGLRWADASTFIQRLWTQPWKFRTVAPDSGELLIWHLPAEKKTGLLRIDRAVRDAGSWFWKDSAIRWRRTASALTGVPRYPLQKYPMDVQALVGARIRHRLGGGR